MTDREEQMTPQFISDAIRREVDKIVEDEARRAEVRVRERVAAAAADIAISVMSLIQVDSLENDLVVRIGRKK